MRILELMRGTMRRQGRPDDLTESSVLSEIGFRSLDFSEVALRIEQQVGHELNFDAGLLRQIRTVADVVNFLLRAAE